MTSWSFFPNIFLWATCTAPMISLASTKETSTIQSIMLVQKTMFHSVVRGTEPSGSPLMTFFATQSKNHFQLPFYNNHEGLKKCSNCFSEILKGKSHETNKHNNILRTMKKSEPGVADFIIGSFLINFFSFFLFITSQTSNKKSTLSVLKAVYNTRFVLIGQLYWTGFTVCSYCRWFKKKDSGHHGAHLIHVHFAFLQSLSLKLDAARLAH